MSLKEAIERGMERLLGTEVLRMLGQRLRLTGLHRGGREPPIEIAPWLLCNDEYWSFYAFARDATERKEIERDPEHRVRTILTDRLHRAIHPVDTVDRLADDEQYRDHRPTTPQQADNPDPVQSRQRISDRKCGYCVRRTRRQGRDSDQLGR